MPEPQNSRPGDDSVSWPEIFSQHELNLNRHLEICGMVKQHVVPESPSSRAISSMVGRTQELLRQLEDLRIEFMPQHTATRILSGKFMNRVNEQRAMNKDAEPVCRQGPTTSQSNTQSVNSQHPRDGPNGAGASIPPFVFDKRPVPVSLPQHLRARNKRSLDDDGGAGEDDVATTALPAGKRKKFYSSDHGGAVNGDNTSAGISTRFVETEDISAEVEARLKAKEERRRRADKREKKRKRSSTGSTSGVPGVESSSQPRAKRSKAYPSAAREEPPATCPTDGDITRQEKRRVVGDAHETFKDNGGSYDGIMYKKRKKSRS